MAPQELNINGWKDMGPEVLNQLAGCHVLRQLDWGGCEKDVVCCVHQSLPFAVAIGLHYLKAGESIISIFCFFIEPSLRSGSFEIALQANGRDLWLWQEGGAVRTILPSRRSQRDHPYLLIYFICVRYLYTILNSECRIKEN
jgi:hypothetical protein